MTYNITMTRRDLKWALGLFVSVGFVVVLVRASAILVGYRGYIPVVDDIIDAVIYAMVNIGKITADITGTPF